MSSARGAGSAALAIILAVALALRLYDVGFGLPSLYDPDEPIFMVMALKLLKQQTLNPGWFGHPGTTTIYLIALIDAAVLGFGMLTGQYETVAQFGHAAYANPALLFVPARVAMALFGVGCVWLTYILGRRLFGQSVGLVGAAFLAVNSLHILWSQVIRTDVMASLFMLASLIFSVRAAEGGRLRDYLLSGAFVGIAIATKWPSAVIVIGLVGAALHRMRTAGEWQAELRHLAAALVCILAALFVASPYIFLDWQTVLANVSGEVNHGHLAQNGGSLFWNLRWYLLGQASESMGLAGLLLAGAGAVVAWRRKPVARWTLLPALGGFLALICSQDMVWSRWLIPAMPLLCLLAAVSLVRVGRWLASTAGSRIKVATALVAAIAIVPSLASASDRIREREVDTRALAADWAAVHIPAGSTVLLENLELKLRDRPWHFLFPLGSAGCVDGLKLLTTGVSYDQLQRQRNGSPIVDIGNVDPSRLGTCHADFAILTYFDSYRSEPAGFPRQLENYHELLEGGRTVALYRPAAGRIGGPIVRVVALKPHSSENAGQIPQIRR